MGRKDKKRKAGKTLADRADKFDLYLEAVQAPDVEVKFLDKAFRHAYGRKPRVLREDFCGTFAICCDWVKSGKDRRAIGVDLDKETLDWGRARHLAKLKEAKQQRVTLLQDDVRRVHDEKADVIAAENFSWFIFKTRAGLLEYLKAAYNNLADEGVMVLDIVGGSEMLQDNNEEITPYKGFKYVWDHISFDPITHDVLFYIHFRFKDGSEITRAFEYDWRLWTIPEARELLEEAGFRETHVYWEGEDKKGEGNGVFKRRKTATCDPSFIAYVVGVK